MRSRQTKLQIYAQLLTQTNTHRMTLTSFCQVHVLSAISVADAML